MEDTKTTTRRIRKSVRTPEVKADFGRMVEMAAYFRAERRGFAPGHAVEDWLAAEAEIEALLAAKVPKHVASKRAAPAKARSRVEAAAGTTASKKRAAPRARKPKEH